MRWRRNMKKRLFALVAAVVMTLSIGMPTMAAPSPTATDSVSGKFAESATAVINGETVDLEFDWGLNTKTLTPEQKAQIEYYMPSSVPEEWEPIPGEDSAARRERVLKKDAERSCELFEKVMGYRTEDIGRKDFFGLSLPAGYTMPAEGVEVTINASYAGKGDYTYYIFHCKADGTWEYIPTTEGDGTLSGRFTSFSPVFIMRVPKTNTLAPSGNTETPSTGNTETIKPTTVGNTTTASTQNVASATSKTTAPKTGDFTEIYVAGMLAVLSVAGVVVYIKREKAVR